MPIRLHSKLTRIFPVLGVFLCPIILMSFMKQVEAWGVNLSFMFLCAILMGYNIPRLIFKFLILAKCPECGRRASFAGGKPTTYHCQKCSYETTVNKAKYH
jgi:hypothetical protein